MARDHARIYAAIWNNKEFVALDEGPQRAFMLALSQPGVTYAGLVPYQPRRWATLSASSTEARLRSQFALLAGAKFVVLDRDTEELLIRSFVRWDGLLSSPNITRSMVKAYRTILSPQLRAVFLTELHRLYEETCADPRYLKGWDVASELLSEPFPEGFGKGFAKPTEGDAA